MYYATRQEMANLDKQVVENGLKIRQMMELAGYHMVEVFKALEIGKEMSVVIVVGKGNKGGDGLCAARHLINNGWKVSVVMVSDDISPDSLHHKRLLKKMGVEIMDFEHSREKIQEADVIIDSLIGYNLDGAPRGAFSDAIECINESDNTTIAYDLPSGIDATTGECFSPCIEASATLTLAMPKKCFKNKEALEKSGTVFVGDIGIPGFLYDKIHQGSQPDFGGAGVILL